MAILIYVKVIGAHTGEIMVSNNEYNPQHHKHA